MTKRQQFLPPRPFSVNTHRILSAMGVSVLQSSRFTVSIVPLMMRAEGERIDCFTVIEFLAW